MRQPRCKPLPSAMLHAALIALAGVIGGCSSFRELHYFSSSGPAPNFYKLEVSGHTAISSSRYLSGYFSESAVDSYFNEIPQPKGAALMSKADQGADASETGEQPTNPGLPADLAAKSEPKVTPVASQADLSDTSLVMILSSNSDEIATQIGAIAESQQVNDMVGRLIARKTLDRGRGAAMQGQVLNAKARSLTTIGDQWIGTLDPEKVGEDDARAAFLAYANAVASELGASKSFSSLDEVATWLSSQTSQAGREE